MRGDDSVSYVLAGRVALNLTLTLTLTLTQTLTLTLTLTLTNPRPLTLTLTLNHNPYASMRGDDSVSYVLAGARGPQPNPKP